MSEQFKRYKGSLNPSLSAGVMTITLADKSKGTCVGNDNRDLYYVVRLMHDLNLVKQTPFLVYFASFLGSNISTLQI